MRRFPWIHQRKKTDPELPLEPPLWFGNKSNGEYFQFASKKDRKIRKLILETADQNARKLGMDRRDFLASTMGMATSLWVLNYVSACSSDSSSSSPASGTKDASATKDTGTLKGEGGYCVPKEAMFDEDAACKALGGKEFIFDIQTHWFKKDDLSQFPAYLSLFGSTFAVTTETDYVINMFCRSDTTMAALSAWPGLACSGMTTTNCGLPLSNPSNAASRDYINALAHNTQRIVNHIQVMAQDANGVELQLEMMAELKCQLGTAAWKLYPGAKLPTVFKMDDKIGRAVIEKGMSLGLPLFCVHKGLPIGTFFDPKGNYPDDIGVVAKDYKDARFIVYHSAICAGTDQCVLPNDGGSIVEGPYDANEKNPYGANALIRSLLDNGIGPNENVYAELGSAFSRVMSDPVQAAHFIGKLMKYVGTDNVCWGSDCVIYGSPQPFIEAFRALTIPDSMRAQYGYPALDDAQKTKIFGLNAAKVYGVNPDLKRCEIDSCPATAMNAEHEAEFGGRQWMFDPPRGPKTLDEYLERAYAAAALGQPA